MRKLSAAKRETQEKAPASEGGPYTGWASAVTARAVPQRLKPQCQCGVMSDLKVRSPGAKHFLRRESGVLPEKFVAKD